MLWRVARLCISSQVDWVGESQSPNHETKLSFSNLDVQSPVCRGETVGFLGPKTHHESAVLTEKDIPEQEKDQDFNVRATNTKPLTRKHE